MNKRLRPLLALLPLSTLMIATTSDAQGCFVVSGKSQTISVTVSGIDTEVNVYYDEGLLGEPDLTSCYARTAIRLSKFPSSRLATRPGEIASSIREVADAWGIKECEIFVSYVNDTNDELASHELCIKGSFKYDKGAYWSSSAETSCWRIA